MTKLDKVIESKIKGTDFRIISFKEYMRDIGSIFLGGIYGIY